MAAPVNRPLSNGATKAPGRVSVERWMMHRSPCLTVLTIALGGCGPQATTAQAPPAGAGATPDAPPTVASTATQATPQPPKTANGQKSCGPLGCQTFDSAPAAFAHILERRPLVLGIGEAHAQQGSEGVRSTTARFTEDLLPLVADRASDIIIELMEPDRRCVETTQQVREKQKAVTTGQAKSNQNEFFTLGTRAKERGVTPHILYPSCEQYQRIIDAGEDFVFVSLETIAFLTDHKAKAILTRNQKLAPEKLVLLYGGAVHNDSVPRQGRERWSYGPSLSTHTQGRYLEVDLIVREFIKDTPVWQGLSWYPHFDKASHRDKAVLFQPTEDSYVLIFPAGSAPSKGEKQSPTP
jgi:hypothetical protein